jgi:hypothetical protein
MELRNLIPGFPLSRGRVIGIAIVAVGAALLFVALSAQSGINDIGATNDPTLQHRLSTLENRRDVAVVTSIGFIFLGLFGIALLVEPSISALEAQSEMISVARMTNQVVRGFSIAGNSSYLPSKHGLSKERIFIIAAPGPATPPVAVSDDLIVSPGKDGSSPGILIEPLGLQLLDSIEKELDIKIANSGLEAAEGSLQMLKHGLGMIKDFHFKEREGKTVLRVEYSGLIDACRAVRRENPDTCRQIGCIGCSCLLTAAARATGRFVNVEHVDNAKDTVVFTLSFRDW